VELVEWVAEAGRCETLGSCDTSAAGIGSGLAGFVKLYKAVPNCPAAIPSSYSSGLWACARAVKQNAAQVTVKRRFISLFLSLSLAAGFPYGQEALHVSQINVKKRAFGKASDLSHRPFIGDSILATAPH
jgi:hypothetical protein